MLNFFKNVKFWGPFVIVAVIFLLMELVLRKGVWDERIEPNSYLGNGVNHAKAIKNYGLDKPNWVSIGNSVLDWGLDHQAIRSALVKKKIDYVRMSMGSSKFPAMQMTAEWSVENMSNLDGVIIGSSESALGNFYMATQYKIAWPFTDAYDNKKYNYDFRNSPLELFYQKLALFVYFDDIKDYFLNYSKRSKRHTLNPDIDEILNTNKPMSKDVCGYELADLSECIETANQIRLKNSINYTEREIIKRCPVKTSLRKLKLNSLSYKINDTLVETFIQNWTTLFTSISQKGVAVKFFILPEHPILQYTTKPRGMHKILNKLLKNLNELDNVTVYDMRNLFSNHPSLEVCKLFNDSLHLSNAGKDILTKELLSSFN